MTLEPSKINLEILSTTFLEILFSFSMTYSGRWIEISVTLMSNSSLELTRTKTFTINQMKNKKMNIITSSETINPTRIFMIFSWFHMDNLLIFCILYLWTFKTRKLHPQKWYHYRRMCDLLAWIDELIAW